MSASQKRAGLSAPPGKRQAIPTIATGPGRPRRGRPRVPDRVDDAHVAGEEVLRRRSRRVGPLRVPSRRLPGHPAFPNW